MPRCTFHSCHAWLKYRCSWAGRRWPRSSGAASVATPDQQDDAQFGGGEFLGHDLVDRELLRSALVEVHHDKLSGTLVASTVLDLPSSAM